MGRGAGRVAVALGVPFVIALLLGLRSAVRRLPWHPFRSMGRGVAEGRARYDDFFGAFEDFERRAERSMFSNLVEDSLPGLLGMGNQSRSSRR